MNEKEKESFDPMPLLENWLKAATDFWGPVMDMWSAASGKTDTSTKQEGSRAKKNLESALRSWKAMSSAMSEPEAGKSILEGIQTLPEIVLKMTQTGWDSYLKLQQQWYERLSRIGQSTEAYRFDNLDQDAVSVWREIYEKEFRQLLFMPQLGLTRSYQERANKAMDNFNLFQAAIAEFLQLLYLPMEKSTQVMQEKVAEMADEGQLPENPKVYYQMWIKILEGHYMTLLKSPEYTNKMDRTLGAFENFVASKNEILQDFLQTLPVPTDKDMDELYQEIYLLKKRMREHEKNHEMETSRQ
ncbi:MAG: poly(R)-hydroxyalkanoic acid synthase subunit PhaE [Desulfobacterales bacterium]